MIAGIPARLGSSRFPKKLLKKLNGRPILWHVWRVTADVFGLENVRICSGDDEIIDLATSWGALTFTSRSNPTNGTERVAEMAFEMGMDEVINVQADDPTITAKVLQELVDAPYLRSEVVTPVYKIPESVNLSDTNLVKVVVESSGRALYFSRSNIPAARDGEKVQGIGHVGLYKYTKRALTDFLSSGPSGLEDLEKLEQLRFLHQGKTIQTFKTSFIPSPIDSPEDLIRLERRLSGGLRV